MDAPDVINALDNIKEGRYKNTMPYPQPLPKTDSISQNEEQKELLNKQRHEWRLAELVLVQFFKRDLEKEFALLQRHHRKIWNIAWEEGHSEGLEEVYYWYERLADIVAEE